MQSGVGKLSCNKTALKRCTSTETLWNRKAPSLSSPEDEEIFLPKLPKSWHSEKVTRFQPRLERRGTDCHYYYYFLNLGRSSRGGRQKLILEMKAQSSERFSSAKLSCSRVALKRCIRTEILCVRSQITRLKLQKSF